MHVLGSADSARQGPLSRKKLLDMLAWQKRARHTDTIVGAPPKNCNKKIPFSGKMEKPVLLLFMGKRF